MLVMKWTVLTYLIMEMNKNFKICMDKNFDKIISHIKDDTMITFKEQQLHRNES